MTNAREVSDPSDPKRPWFEPACAILMAIASVGTAWCSYQSSRWSSENNELDQRVNELQRQATAWHLEARQVEAVQMRLVMEVIDARLQGNETLARFYTDRFADELKPAFEKWMALRPFDNPVAPPHPFVRELYTPRFEQETRDANAEVAEAEARSSATRHFSSSYLSNTVSLATVLFFAATAEKFEQRRVRWSALVFAVALLLYASARTFMLPIA